MVEKLELIKQQLWVDVYMASLKKDGLGDSRLATNRANLAVRAFENRFGE